MARLSGKSALVIGAATGIGRAVALAFADEGARVMVADCGREDERRKLVAEIEVSAGQADHLDCDVLVEAQIADAVAQTIERLGQLDILVNNAGVGAPAKAFHDLDDSDLARVFDVNLRGTALGMRHALPHMIDRGSGRIINTASQLAHKPAPWYAAYCASKAAVVALSASVAAEVARLGVTVNCVCPGPTDTQLWRDGDAAWGQWKAEQLPIGRIGQPSEVAGAYVYLASDEASFMIGQSISPNGGDVSW